MTLQHCPACDGNGGRYAVTSIGNGFLRCGLCAASGQVTQEQIEQYREGQAFRVEREGREEGLRECAKRLGVSPTQLSRFERGEAKL